MLATRVIPCLDVRDGRVVKGIRFQGLRDAGDPAERAAAYEAQGADELVLLDVSATPEGRAHGLETVRAVRRVLGIPLTVGGGVRGQADALALLEAGADKVAVNTAAVERPELLEELAFRFGCQCTVLALDARALPVGETAQRAPGPAAPPGSPAHVDEGSQRWEVVVRSGREPTGADAVVWALEAVRRGAGEILLTSWDRDGTRSGYDTALIRAVTNAVRVPVVASGGAADPEHLVEAARAGASAVLAASIFHDGDHTVGDVKRVLAAAGLVIRPL